MAGTFLEDVAGIVFEVVMVAIIVEVMTAKSLKEVTVIYFFSAMTVSFLEVMTVICFFR